MARAGRLGLADDHNFLVRTPFQVLLDYMERPLSQYFIHIPMENSA